MAPRGSKPYKFNCFWRFPDDLLHTQDCFSLQKRHSNLGCSSPPMMRVASFENWDSHLSNAATLVDWGVYQLEIQSGFAKALDLEGSWENKCHLEFPCDIYFADTGSSHNDFAFPRGGLILHPPRNIWYVCHFTGSNLYSFKLFVLSDPRFRYFLLAR